MQVQSKSFSEEKMLENKGLHLALIQVIISKMNGDFTKYTKICGSFLSEKAKEMVETRMSKLDSTNELIEASKPVRKAKMVRSSSSEVRSVGSSNKSNVGEELPELNLKTTENGTDGPFKFSFGSEEPATVSVEGPHLAISQREGSSGAAANLRERLRSIRDKHKQEGLSSSPESNGLDSQSSLCPLYNDISHSVEILLGEPTPLLEIDDKFTNALVCLRQLHSSLSNNGNDSTGTDRGLLHDLRQHLQSKVPVCVKMMTRYVVAFDMFISFSRSGVSFTHP